MNNTELEFQDTINSAEPKTNALCEPTNNAISAPQMMTIRQTAKATGFSEHGIRRLVKDNRIVHIRVGNTVLINLERFIAFLNTGD